MVFNNAEKIVDYATYVKSLNLIKFDFAMAKEGLKGFNYYQNFKSVKKQYAEYLKKYKPLMVNVVNRILKLFSGFLKDYNYMVILNGSFARNSYREFSDIDVSFVLTKKKTKAFVVFEELFYYALTYVLGIGRERMHSIFNRFVVFDKQRDYDNEVVLSWADGKNITYHIKEKAAYELYLSCASERSYQMLLGAIEKQINDDVVSQMAYSYEVLFNNTEYNLENDIMAIEFKNRKNFNMPKYDIVMSNLKRAYVTRDLKVIIKDLFQNDLYEFASYVRHYLVRKNNYRKLLDLNEVFDSSLFGTILGKNQKKLKDNYHEYLFYLTRLEMCLNKVDVELSSHDETFIDCNRLQKFYEVKFKSNEEVLDKLFRIIADNREIYKSALASL